MSSLYIKFIEITGNKFGGITTTSHAIDESGKKVIFSSVGKTDQEMITIPNPQSYRSFQRNLKKEPGNG